MLHDSAKKKIEGKQPGELVPLALWLTEPQLSDDEVRELLGSFQGVNLIQTSMVATVDVPVEFVEGVEKLPSVREVR